MSLKELRTIEELLRHDLEAVRAQLSASVQARDAGRAAEHDLDAMQDAARAPEGAYRGMASERAAELRARVEAGRLADGQRERLRREETRLLGELQRARLDIERQGVKQSLLPILDDVPDASPCTVRWDEMRGDGDARVCPHCDAAVLNVALLEGPQAEELLDARPAGTHLFRRADGTFIAGDCGRAPSRLRFARVAATVAGVLIGLAAAAGVVLSRSAPLSSPFDKSRPLPALPDHGVHIEDKYETLGGGHTLSADLARQGTELRADVRCAAHRNVAATLGAAPYDEWMHALARHRVDPDGALLQCNHTDDYPEVTITFVGTDHVLSVHNCSWQWLFDGMPLSGDTRDIGEAYRKLTQPLPSECSRAAAAPTEYALAPSVEIHDTSYSDYAGGTFALKLSRANGAVTADLRCTGVQRTTPVQAPVLDAFLATLEGEHPTERASACGGPFGLSRTVTIKTAKGDAHTLEMHDCARQWRLDAVPLAADASRAITVAYDALVSAAGAQACNTTF